MNPGDKLGEYEIVAPLKRGGMATLYLGCRTGAGGFAKHVAIKVVHPHLAGDRKFVEMFLDEARLSARIDHPNVVHVYELGEGDESTYHLVMEYVHGCSLSQLLTALAKAERKLSPELAAFIGMRVAAGLHSAHEVAGPDGELLGVVHRDISPQNVLLAYKGYVKLIDFGIAKMRGRVHQTTTGSLKGKFRYMAPEQAAGQPVDRRTDVYALGIVLWEMLTMRRLFDATDELQLIEQIRRPEVPAPRTLASDVPDALDRVVMHALAPDPAERPQSAYELQRELAEALPSALAMDAPDLARLLHAIMGEAIRADAEWLPGSLSKVVSAEQGRAEEPSGQVMDALTVATPGLSEGGFHDVTVESDETEASEPLTSEPASPAPPDATATENQGAASQEAGADKSTVRLGSFASAPSAGPAPASGLGSSEGEEPAAAGPSAPSEPPRFSQPALSTDPLSSEPRRSSGRLVRVGLPLAAAVVAAAVGVGLAVAYGGEEEPEAEAAPDAGAPEAPIGETAQAPAEHEAPAPAREDEGETDPGLETAPSGPGDPGDEDRPAEATARAETSEAEAEAEADAKQAKSAAERRRERLRQRRLRQRRARERNESSDVDGVPIVEDVEF